ncbi:MAG: triose-phosphate isomerase [Patescibacteria group bacterium]
MKKLIVANWKMQLSYNGSLVLAKKIKQKIKSRRNEVVICPDYLSLAAVAGVLKNSQLQLGAQDSAINNFGAYTGEVSPLNLKAQGVKYVILGHSERREQLHESSQIVNNKIKAALKNKLVPILCVGEKLAEKEQGGAKSYISEQLRHSLKGVNISKPSDLVVAYEPLWAIGTGQAIIPLEAQIIIFFIKQQAAKILKKNIRVLYGGSVNFENSQQFLKEKDVDGLLVGGAALKEEFIKICL